MVKVIGVKFKTSSRVYYFDPLDLPFETGDGAIVETSRGLEFGEVAQGIKEVEETEIVAPLKPVLRIATDEDKRMRKEYAAKEPEAFAICEEKIKEHNLDMKLVDAEYIFNGSKIVFYFTADERVDFRDLVKDLAYTLRTRIELRQIGVRDEAKMLGGLGPCGRPVCCNAFLDDFRPVSIKMAKEQNLSLSPTKISGLCGRLMCCLQYEQNVYESMKKVMPKVGKEINTIDGVGVVVENNAITERTKVRLTMEDGSIDVREYPYTHLGLVGEPLPEAATAQTEPKPEGESDFASMAKRENANRRSRRPAANNTRQTAPQTDKPAPEKKDEPVKEQPKAEDGKGRNRNRGKKPNGAKPDAGEKKQTPKAEAAAKKPNEGKPQGEQKPNEQKQRPPRRKPQGEQNGQGADAKPNAAKPQTDNTPSNDESKPEGAKRNNRRRRPRRPGNQPNGEQGTANAPGESAE